MPFIPTPIAGALSATQNTKRNVGKRQGDDDVAPVAGESTSVTGSPIEEPRKRNTRNAFQELFFGPGR